MPNRHYPRYNLNLMAILILLIKKSLFFLWKRPMGVWQFSNGHVARNWQIMIWTTSDSQFYAISTRCYFPDGTFRNSKQVEYCELFCSHILHMLIASFSSSSSISKRGREVP